MGELVLRAVLILAGLAFVGCEVYGAYEYLWGKFGIWNYLVFGGILLTAGSAILPSAAEFANAQGAKLKKWGAWLAIPLSLAFVFTASIERTGSVTDTNEAARQQVVRVIATAEAEIVEALTQLPIDKELVRRNCEVFGPKCTRAKDDQAATERKLAEARAVIKKQGVAVDDPMAARLAAYLPFLTKEMIQLYHPMLLPLSLALVGALLMSIGMHRKPVEGREPAEPEPAKPEPAPEPVPIMIKPAPARPQLVVNNDVPAMLLKLLDRAPGERIEMGEILLAYATQCRAEGKKPALPDPFADGLEKFCKDADIETKTIKGRFYLLDVQLVSPMPQATSNASG